MNDQTNQVGMGPGAAAQTQEAGVSALGRGGRMSRQRKAAAVLRLLRGEDLETVSRSLGVTAATVNFHIEHAKKKLDTRTRAHAVALALLHGFF